MRICLLLPGQPLRWHVMLADMLGARGAHEVVVRRNGEARPLPAALRLLFAFERLVYRRGGEELLDAVSVEAAPELASAPPDGTFDLVMAVGTGTGSAPAAPRSLAAHFDGQPSELGAAAALIDGRPFSIGVIETTAAGRQRHDVPPAVDDGLIVSTSLANVCSRIADLLAVHVERGGRAATSAGGSASPRADAARPLAHRIGWHGLAVFEGKLRHRLMHLAAGAERWAIGWRDVGDDGPLVGGASRAERFRLIADDGRRYFADPFLVRQGSRTHIFCEEFPFATAKGVISVFTRQGCAAPVYGGTILEQPFHLSFPQVFEDGGQHWMIPEAGASGRIDLYRAIELPHRWEHAATLIEGIRAYDPTLHYDGRDHWMLLTSAELHSSPNDRLSLYRAPRLTGPWQRCGDDPIAVDPAAARPGSRIVAADGGRYRLAQDCRRIYGGALAVRRIVRLDADGLVEESAGRLEARAGSGFTGLHTWDHDGRTEVIDVFGFPTQHASAEAVFAV